jgi:excisionase family DNA binding protein
MPQDDLLLTTTDAARAIGVSAETIRAWENSGKLPALRTVSGQRLFSRRDVDRARDQRTSRRAAHVDDSPEVA